MSDIAFRVKQVRKDWGLNQVEFAKRIGVTNAHISAIEKGKTTPSQALIKLICQQYKINERWLLEGEEPMNAEDVEMLTEHRLTRTYDLLNKIRTQDNIQMRAKVSHLEKLFVDMLDLPRASEEVHGQYLDILFKMLYHIEVYLSYQKKRGHVGQLSIFPYPDDLADNLKKDIEEFEMFFDKIEGK